MLNKQILKDYSSEVKIKLLFILSNYAQELKKYEKICYHINCIKSNKVTRN